MLTIDDVSATWVGAAELSPAEDCVLTEVFWRLLRGAPVSTSELRASLDLSAESVEALLAGLEAKRCLRRQKDRTVIAARGLMIEPSPHQLITEQGRVYTQCAVDAIGIPAALGVSGTIEDQCALCTESITISVAPSGDAASQPEAAVIVMVQPDSCVEEGVPRMCRETNLFCSREHAAVWLRDYATLPGAIGTPQDAVSLGRVLWGRFAREDGRSKDSDSTVADLFQVLASPIRLGVVRLLLDGERCVGDLLSEMGIAQPRLSNHLACLRTCGLVRSRRQGNFVYYAIADPRVVEMVRMAGAIAALNAQELASCDILLQERS